MPETNISSSEISDLTNAITPYSVTPMSTDGIADQAETTYMNNEWSQQLGYYKQIPELNVTINAKATWTVGKGYMADDETTMLLQTFNGWGNDTFNTIIENMMRTYLIGGDSFAEIIRDDDDVLINLKPLDPGVMRVVVGRNGRIKRYEQLSKVKQQPKKFKTEDILHLSRNRVADEIHGDSLVNVLANIILMRNEAMTSYKQVMQRYMKPRYVFHLDTDDTAKIAEFKAKMDKAWADGENIYVPKGIVVPELQAVSPNATLNPQTWIDSLNQYFYQASEGTDIVIGVNQSITESNGKIRYLAFQQFIEADQLYLEEQILAQLNLEIEFNFPASLENELLSDEKKDGQGETAVEPNDTTTELEGKK